MERKTTNLTSDVGYLIQVDQKEPKDLIFFYYFVSRNNWNPITSILFISGDVIVLLYGVPVGEIYMNE